MNQNQNQGQTQRQYNEVGQSGSNNQRWEPTKNENNPGYPKFIEGYFKAFREMPGGNGPFMVAEIQMMNPDGSLGILVDVSGGKVLEGKLGTIPLGSFIMIEFLGKVKGKGPNTYNSWKTLVDEGAVPLHKILGTPAPIQHNAFNNAPVQQNQAPAFNNAPAFGQQVQNNAPAFNTGAPVQQNNASAFNQNQGANPFAQINNDDLPF